MIRRAFLVALLVALPLAAETMPGARSWRVTLAVHTGEDSAAVAKRLAAMYRGELETPVDANGSFLMSLTDAAAAVLGGDANVESVQPAAAVPMPSTPSAVPAMRPPQLIAHASTNWALGPYSYDGAGNIESIGTDRYVYDSTNRLVSGTAGGKTETYSYDEFGNIQSITTSGSPTRWLGVAPASNRMDQTTGIINNQSVTFDVSAGYDANGNVSSSGLDWFEYDGVNVLRKSRIAGTWRSYVYTASDERIAVIKRADQSGAETRSDWTLRDPSGQVLRRISREAGQWEWDQDYVYRGSQMLASEVTGPAKRYHYHLDHLGTPRLITGNGGVEVSRHTYLPFGTEVGAAPGQNTPEGEWKKFTGHERDHGSIDYMHARYYNPFMGRFLAVDPSANSIELTMPQSWNRYSYTLNNPLIYVDPTGRVYRCALIGEGESAKWDCFAWIDVEAKAPVTQSWPVASGLFEYATRDDAALAAIEVICARSVQTDREFGGALYESDGLFGFSSPRQGGRHSMKGILGTNNVWGADAVMSLLPPPGVRLVGTYHTHGAYSDGYADEALSPNDREVAYKEGYTAYLGTPSGRVLKYDPRTPAIRANNGFDLQIGTVPCR